MGLGAFEDQVIMFGQTSAVRVIQISPARCPPADSRPLSRARATLAKRGRPPWPVRRLGAFAQRGRAHCASWATCREQFGLLFEQSARRIVPQRMLDVCRGGCWHHGSRRSWTSSTSTIPLHYQGRVEKPFLSSRNGLCQVDSLTAPPADTTQREVTSPSAPLTPCRRSGSYLTSR